MTSNGTCPPVSTATVRVAVEHFIEANQVKNAMRTNTSKPDIKSAALRNAYDDFILSRQAIHCSSSTLEFYQNTARKFILWMEQEERSITEPIQVNSHIVRAFLAEIGKRTKSDWTLNDYGRAIHTVLHFWHTEGYIPKPIDFEIHPVKKKENAVSIAK